MASTDDEYDMIIAQRAEATLAGCSGRTEQFKRYDSTYGAWISLGGCIVEVSSFDHLRAALGMIGTEGLGGQRADYPLLNAGFVRVVYPRDDDGDLDVQVRRMPNERQMSALGRLCKAYKYPKGMVVTPTRDGRRYIDRMTVSAIQAALE